MRIGESIQYLEERTYDLEIEYRHAIEEYISELIIRIADAPGNYVSTPAAQKPGVGSVGASAKCPRCGDPIKVFVTR